MTRCNLFLFVSFGFMVFGLLFLFFVVKMFFHFCGWKMFKMEFMILYLAEIAMAALLLLAVYVLVWLVSTVTVWIGMILKKGGKRHGESG